jgi:hypothetical protein
VVRPSRLHDVRWKVRLARSNWPGFQPSSILHWRLGRWATHSLLAVVTFRTRAPMRILRSSFVVRRRCASASSLPASASAPPGIGPRSARLAPSRAPATRPHRQAASFAGGRAHSAAELRLFGKCSAEGRGLDPRGCCAVWPTEETGARFRLTPLLFAETKAGMVPASLKSNLEAADMWQSFFCPARLVAPGPQVYREWATGVAAVLG